MSFLNKVAETIGQKLESSTSQLGYAVQEKMRRNPLSGEIFEVMGEAISKKMSSHFNNVYKYFTSDTHPEALMEQAADEIDHKQTQAMQRLMQNLEKSKPVQLDYDYNRDVRKELAERRQNMEEQQQMARESDSQNEEQQTQTPTPLPEEPEKAPLVILEVRPYRNIETNHSQMHTPFKSNSQIGIQTQNPQKFSVVKSQFIQKRDIVKELQARRQLTRERERKSHKMKSRIIKLQPLARQKDQQMKEKQTKERLSNAIDFVSSLQLSRQISNHKPTEWRQERTAPSFTPSQSNGDTLVSKLKYSNKKRLEQLGFSPIRADRSSFIPSKQKERSRSREEPFVLPKPLPYNLYTINQSKNEMFKLKLI